MTDWTGSDSCNVNCIVHSKSTGKWTMITLRTNYKKLSGLPNSNNIGPMSCDDHN